MLRTIRVILPENGDIRATVYAFRDACAIMSPIAFNEGKPLSENKLRSKCYYSVKRDLPSAQMVCSVARRVAAAYAAAKKKKRPATRSFSFVRPCGTWLIDGDHGRDARICKDGTISIWTLAGRKRVMFTIPKAMQADFDAAIHYNSLEIYERKGKLIARLAITLPDPPATGTNPVGVDLNETNAFVAVDAADRELFISGRKQKVRSKRTYKTRKRLQRLLATRKAQKRSTKSVGKALKRLGGKQHNRTRDFARCSAKELVKWAPKDAVFVLEELKLPQATKKRVKGKSPKATALRRKLSGFSYSAYRTAIVSRAERMGHKVEFVNPKYTSQDCSICHKRGTRVRHRFVCNNPTCGHVDHADVNAARNIRNLYGAERRRGL